MRHAMDLQGLWVNFAIRDITFPTPDAVLRALHADDVLIGQVVDVSDSGAKQDEFIVVKVEGLEEPVVVPVARIRDWRRT
jgi:pyridoxal biosynthesis lyase PdxS